MRTLGLLLVLTITVAAPARGQEVLLPEADLAFVANLGQLDGDTNFFVTATRFAAGLNPTGGALALRVPEPATANGAFPPAQGAYDAWANAKVDILRWQFVGAKAGALAGDGVRPGVVHFLDSEDQSRWRTDVPRYSRVRYATLYPHIAHIVSGPGRALQFDFEVEPGGHPSEIEIAFGDAAVSPASEGRLKLLLPNGSLFLSAPRAWQGEGKDRKAVAIVYRLTQAGTVGFSVGAYDAGRTLFIDPIIDVAVYVNGSGNDAAHAVATDAMSNYYIAGSTASPELVSTAPSPGLPGAYSFVAKIDSTGTPIFMTVLGPGIGRSIAADAAFNIYVAGVTRGRLPLAGPHRTAWGGGASDGFVTKLAASGSSRVYSQYVGGRGTEEIAGLALGRENELFLFGDTDSDNFPRYASGSPVVGWLRGRVDVFLMRLDALGSPTDSFTLGGPSVDNAGAIAVDVDGAVFIAGTGNLPTTAGAWRPSGSGGFVAKLNGSTAGPGLPPYRMLWSTGLGGAVPNAIALPPGSSTPVVAGQTIALDLPTTPGAFREYFTRLGPDGSIIASHTGEYAECHARGLPCWDAFVAKISADGSRAHYYTYLGDFRDDAAIGVAVDAEGYAYVTGRTVAPWDGILSAFPITFDAFRPFHDAFTGGFVTVFNPAGDAVAFSSFLDGSGDAIVLDRGRILVAGWSNGEAFLIRATR